MTIAVSCRIAGRAISVIDCIIKQWDERCHCPEAKLAIDEKPMGLPGRILLPVLQQRELKFSTKSESDQFTGPAVAARNNDLPSTTKKPPSPLAVKVPIEEIQERKEDYFTKSKGGRKIACPKCGERTMIQSLRRHIDYFAGAKGVCRACQTILGIAGLVPRHRRVKEIATADEEVIVEETPVSLPDPKDLHLDYLVSCVEEAKRRLDLLDTALTP